MNDFKVKFRHFLPIIITLFINNFLSFESWTKRMVQIHCVCRAIVILFLDFFLNNGKYYHELHDIKQNFQHHHA